MSSTHLIDAIRQFRTLTSVPLLIAPSVAQAWGRTPSREAAQRHRQQGADIAYEWLIGAVAVLSPNPGKFQFPLGQKLTMRQRLLQNGVFRGKVMCTRASKAMATHCVGP